jgi:hypothetical protein
MPVKHCWLKLPNGGICPFLTVQLRLTVNGEKVDSFSSTLFAFAQLAAFKCSLVFNGQNKRYLTMSILL